MNFQDDISVFNGNAMQKAWRRYIEEIAGDGDVQFVTLHPDRAVASYDAGRQLLYRWDALMNSAFIHPAAWKKKPNLRCRWCAVPEGKKSNRHWHLLFNLSPDIRSDQLEQKLRKHLGHEITDDFDRNLALLIEAKWKKVSPAGTAVTILKYGHHGLANYMSKESWCRERRDEILFAPQMQKTK